MQISQNQFDALVQSTIYATFQNQIYQSVTKIVVKQSVKKEEEEKKKKKGKNDCCEPCFFLKETQNRKKRRKIEFQSALLFSRKHF